MTLEHAWFTIHPCNTECGEIFRPFRSRLINLTSRVSSQARELTGDRRHRWVDSTAASKRSNLTMNAKTVSPEFDGGSGRKPPSHQLMTDGAGYMNAAGKWLIIVFLAC